MSWGDLATLEYGKGLRGYHNSDGQFPVFGTNGQIGSHSECLYPNDGVIVGRKGAYRGIHYSASPFFVIDTAFYLKPIVDGSFSMKWAYYQLLDFDINKIDSGSAIPSTSREAFYAIQLCVPPLPTQLEIAAILSAYDNLIANNLRRIKILQQMAQNLYREWFVNFHFPGHLQARFTDSPLGRIPAGWEAAGYSDLLKSSLGGDWGAEKPTEKENVRVIVIRGTDFDDIVNGTTLRAPVRYISQSSFEKRRLQPGDIIIENSVNAKTRCVGRSILISQDLTSRIGGDAICASFSKVFRPRNPRLGALLQLHLGFLYSEGKMAFYQNVATNGIGNFQSKRFIESERIVLPRDEVLLDKVTYFLNDINASIALCANRNSNLRRTRDLLLHRLISGEVDVTDMVADRHLEQ